MTAQTSTIHRLKPATPLQPLVLEPPRHVVARPHVLTPGRHRIGVDRSCEIVVAAEGVAPLHAVIWVGTHRTVLRNWDPHTWLNDGPVSEAALRKGDRLAIGPMLWTVRTATTDELLSAWPEPASTFPEPGSEPKSSRRGRRPNSAKIARVVPAAASVSSAEIQRLAEDLRALRAATEQFRAEWQTDVASRERWNDQDAEARQARRHHDQEVLERLESARQALIDAEQRLAARESKLRTFEVSLQQLESQLFEERTRLEQLASVTREQLAQESTALAANALQFETSQSRLLSELTDRSEQLQSQVAAHEQAVTEFTARQTQFEAQLAEFEQSRSDSEAIREELRQSREQLARERAEFDAERAAADQQQSAWQQEHAVDQSLREQWELDRRQLEERCRAIEDERNTRELEASTASVAATAAQSEVIALQQRLAVETARLEAELVAYRSERDSAVAETQQLAESLRQLEHEHRRSSEEITEQLAAGKAHSDSLLEQLNLLRDQLAQALSARERADSTLAEAQRREAESRSSEIQARVLLQQDMQAARDELRRERELFSQQQQSWFDERDHAEAALRAQRRDLDEALAQWSHHEPPTEVLHSVTPFDLTEAARQFDEAHAGIVSERDALRDQRDRLVAELEQNRQELEREHEELAEARRRLDRIVAVLEAEVAAATDERSAIVALQRQLAVDRSQLSVEQAALAERLLAEHVSRENETAQRLELENAFARERAEFVEEQAQATAAREQADLMLAEREARLNERESELAEERSALDQQRQQVLDRLEQLDARGQQLDAKEQELDARRQELDSSRKELAERAAELNGLRSEIERTRATFGESEARLEEERRQLSSEWTRVRDAETAAQLATEEVETASRTAREQLESDRIELDARAAALEDDLRELNTEQSRLDLQRQETAAARLALDQREAEFDEAIERFEAEAAAFKEERARWDSESQLARDQIATERQRWVDHILALRELEPHANLSTSNRDDEPHPADANDESTASSHESPQESDIDWSAFSPKAHLARSGGAPASKSTYVATSQAVEDEADQRFDPRYALRSAPVAAEEQTMSDLADPHASAEQFAPEDASRALEPQTGRELEAESQLDSDVPAGETTSKTADGKSVSLREELARMFDLPADLEERHRQRELIENLHANDDEDAHDDDEVASTLDESAEVDSASATSLEPPPDTSWRSKLTALIEADGASPKSLDAISPVTRNPVADAPPSVQVSVEKPSATPETESTSESHEDSVAEYMERLLARQRRDNGGSRPIVSSPVVEPAAVESRSVIAEAGVPGVAPVEAAGPPPEPRHKIDREATRAEMQSFREVANLSARAALARHSGRTGKTDFLIQAGLSVAATTSSMVFLAAPLWGGTPQLLPGVGSLIAAAAMGSRAIVSWSRWKMWLNGADDDTPPLSSEIPAARLPEPRPHAAALPTGEADPSDE